MVALQEQAEIEKGVDDLMSDLRVHEDAATRSQVETARRVLFAVHRQMQV
jgi:hypothetical protein